jgi:modification methylase
MRSDDWFIPICSGDERLTDSDDNKVHSTQKPEELLKRVMLSTSRPGDVILDPFFGSGTTGAVAKKLGRHFIGIEREDKYIKAATARIKLINPETGPEGFMPFAAKREKPRVSVLQVIEAGVLKVGERVTDKMGRFEAVICADGLLMQGDGPHKSIHKMGAEMMEAPSMNGWTFWHIERGGRRIVLDEFRETARKKLFADTHGQRSMLLPIKGKK